MPEESKDNLDALDSLLSETQADDPMHQKGAPTPVPNAETKALDNEPLQPFQKDEPPPPAQAPSELDALVKKFMADGGKVLKLALDRSGEDRSETQEVIDHLKSKLFATEGKSATAGELECLAALLRVKTDATGNLAKLGDTVARLVAAGKGMVTNQSSTFDVDELSEIREALKQPDYKDTPQG